MQNSKIFRAVTPMKDGCFQVEMESCFTDVKMTQMARTIQIK